MGAMALLPICNSSFTCDDYNIYKAHPWSPFPLRRAHSEPGLYTARAAWACLPNLRERFLEKASFQENSLHKCPTIANMIKLCGKFRWLKPCLEGLLSDYTEHLPPIFDLLSAVSSLKVF